MKRLQRVANKRLRMLWHRVTYAIHQQTEEFVFWLLMFDVFMLQIFLYMASR